MNTVQTVQLDTVQTGQLTALPVVSSTSTVANPFRGLQLHCTVPGRGAAATGCAPDREKLQNYQAALKNIPAPGKGCHPYLLSVANRGVRVGLDDKDVVEDIAKNIPHGKREVTRREIEQAVARARADFENPKALPAPKKPAGRGWALTARLVRQYAGTTLKDLQALSPVAVPQDPVEQCKLAVARLFAPTAWLYIGPARACAVRGFNLKTAADWLDFVGRSGQVPAEQIMLNALTGNAGKTQAGAESYRCGETVAEPARYFLVEFDGMPEGQQAAFWYGILCEGLLDLGALVHSGGRSIHGWVRAPATVTDKARWRAYVDNLYDAWLAPQGGGVPTELRADRACRDIGRLTRCPGWARADRGNRQQTLLFLKPGG